MKKVFAILAIVGVMVACNNKSDKKVDAAADSAKNMMNNAMDTAGKMMNNVADSAGKMMNNAMDTVKSKM